MRRLLLVLALSLIASPAFAKSLYWRTFDVKARLDSDGRLHVREQQGIVFDGDWNGGERRFNIRPGQSLDLERVLCVENGQDMPMTRGDLSQVDHWDFVGDNVVRWRSRRPSDPPFQNREIDYAIEYVLSGILQKSDRGARLHHDFAFPDRAGVIQNFSLRLDLDPAWRGLINPYVLQRQTMPPGESAFADADLTYAGQGSPAAVRHTISTSEARIIVLLLLIAGAALAWKFYTDEAHKGRFGPLFPSAAIDQKWLDRYVFSLPPEAVGYAWDEVNGAPEVGAVIARMEQEKKLTTSVKPEPSLFGDKPVLHLKLNVAPNTLPDGEKDLIQALFLGKTETDTDQIRQHYRSTGFQPQKLIKGSIDSVLAGVPEWNQPAASVSMVEVFTFIATLVAGGIALKGAHEIFGYLLAAGFIAFAGLGVSISARRRVDAGPWPPMIFAGAMILAGAIAVFAAVSAGLTLFAAAAIALAMALVAASLLMISRSREAIPKIAFRRRLAAARDFFETQLRAANTKLHDQWYPYLIALGLGPNVDRWFKDFSQASAGIVSRGSSSFGSSSSPSTSSWTGGGGAFGGAGATGSWAAVSAIAAGVAAPSSSGGGGGGGAGSGGGGGGGW